ncbi:ABC transporter substrate-binding protein [Streptomyces formicae]|uniref:ABC transporter substrate-binding protein n=1 Tax=Streptomyces formicae TaxID=1616117 RepID=A0ABY3WMT9_9ACTN|nr:ABC transporter substrate-binding protein [Streptomyces formicae]UNM12622.1 ABC transporter substrate-binding protein [Streptomyces formicae]
MHEVLSRTAVVRTAAVTAALTALLTANACTAGTTSRSSDNADRAESIVLSPGNQTSFTRNYNIYSPAADKSPSANLIYEPLLRLNPTDGGKIEPWLAESHRWSEDGKKLTFVIREGVKWSDGKPLTAGDVEFSLNVPLKDPALNIMGVTYTSVKRTGASSVTVTFPEPSLRKINTFAPANTPGLLIVPEHIWSKQNVKTWTNPDPVGTGPVTLAQFTGQQITLRTRSDYWNGALPMKQVKLLATGGPDSTKPRLLKGDIDFATIAWANADKEFVAKNPTTNVYQAIPTGGQESLLINNAKPPLNDVHVRRALSLALDRASLVELSPTGQRPADACGLDVQIYRDWTAPDCQDNVVTQNTAEAKRELAAAGYKVSGGALSKGGKEYRLSLGTVQEYANWSAYSKGMRQQWKESLGLDVKVDSIPGSNFGPALQKGDFDLAINFSGSGDGIYAAFSGILDPAQYVPLGKSAAVGNVIRWRDRADEDTLRELEKAASEAEIKELGQKLQRTVLDEVPYAPLFSGVWFVNINSARWTGWPQQGKAAYVPVVTRGTDMILTLKNLKPTAK